MAPLQYSLFHWWVGGITLSHYHTCYYHQSKVEKSASPSFYLINANKISKFAKIKEQETVLTKRLPNVHIVKIFGWFILCIFAGGVMLMVGGVDIDVDVLL